MIVKALYTPKYENNSKIDLLVLFNAIKIHTSV